MEHGKPILFHRKRRRIKRKIEYWKTAGEGGEGKGRKRWKHKRISNSNGCIPAMHQQQRCHQWLQLSRTHNLPPSKKSELSGLATCSTGSTKTTSTPASLTPARCSLWFLPFFFLKFCCLIFEFGYECCWYDYISCFSFLVAHLIGLCGVWQSFALIFGEYGRKLCRMGGNHKCFSDSACLGFFSPFVV